MQLANLLHTVQYLFPLAHFTCFPSLACLGYWLKLCLEGHYSRASSLLKMSLVFWGYYLIKLPAKDLRACFFFSKPRESDIFIHLYSFALGPLTSLWMKRMGRRKPTKPWRHWQWAATLKSPLGRMISLFLNSCCWICPHSWWSSAWKRMKPCYWLACIWFDWSILVNCRNIMSLLTHL